MITAHPRDRAKVEKRDVSERRVRRSLEGPDRQHPAEPRNAPAERQGLAL
jgi:hypothetical protein